MPPLENSLTRPQYPKELIATNLIQGEHDRLMHQFGLGKPLEAGSAFKRRETHNIRLFDRADAFRIKPVLRGDEELIRRLSVGPGILAREFKKGRADFVRKTLIPVLKSQIPRSKRKFRKAGHLRSTARVVSSTLERVVVVTGNPKVWWSSIVHAKWSPYFPITLLIAGDKFQKAYEVMIKNFMVWLSSTNLSRTEYSKESFRLTPGTTFKQFQNKISTWGDNVGFKGKWGK